MLQSAHRAPPKLQTLVNRAVPQLVLRLGYPEGDMPATPRRPIRDVVETVRRGRTAAR